MGNFGSRIVLLCLNRYRRFFSPLLPSACRFHPTCSRYAEDCFRTHRFSRALFLTARRIMRCHPYCDGGLDPVPGAP